MKIFITGVAGFLGSNVANHMIKLGNKVVGVDNLSGGFMDNVNPEVEFYKEDCIDIEKMKEYSKDCDLIFHAACTAHEGVSVFSPFFITQNTFQITMSVLSAAIQNKVKKFVFCSSMARYGYQEILPYTEDMICNPQDPYSVAKYASELVIQKLAPLNGMKYVIAVPHNIYGPGQNYLDPYRNVASIMINRMLKGQAPIVYGTGKQTRCFSYIDDVVDAFEKIMFQDDLNSEIINIGPDKEFISINELVSILNDIIGTNYEPIYVDGRPMEVEKAYCSSEKMRRLLGFSSEVSLREGLTELVKYIKDRGPKDFIYENIPIEIKTELTPKTWTKRMI